MSSTGCERWRIEFAYELGIQGALEAFKLLADEELKSGDGRALRVYERYKPQILSMLPPNK